MVATPAPQPERAIYGFFLLSTAILSFTIYCLISYLPSSLLGQLGWDYLPDKYWYIAVPAYTVVCILMVVPVYLALNIGQAIEPSSINNLTDEYTLRQNTTNQNSNHTQGRIDPVYDIPISEACAHMYLNINN